MQTEKIIELRNLTKKFKSFTAVDDLNLTVYKGDVFGFLGPNGAGKSTTIRMLLSLIQPTNGEINVFNKSLKQNRMEILKRIGAIVEKPDFYLYLTAYKNLELFGKLSSNEISKNRIMEMLELVGLSERYNSKVKTFSHGMKQRLGLAQALLHDPELIVLDEPTTGLDPQGMKEIRDLIISLSKEHNKTILLSSHILKEVEVIANRMIIINKGKSIVEGNVDELLNSQALSVTFELENITKTKELLNNSKWADKNIQFIDSQFKLDLTQQEIPMLNKHLVENKINVKSIIPTKSLEEFFLRITEGVEK